MGPGSKGMIITHPKAKFHIDSKSGCLYCAWLSQKTQNMRAHIKNQNFSHSDLGSSKLYHMWLFKGIQNILVPSPDSVRGTCYT